MNPLVSISTYILTITVIPPVQMVSTAAVLPVYLAIIPVMDAPYQPPIVFSVLEVISDKLGPMPVVAVPLGIMEIPPLFCALFVRPAVLPVLLPPSAPVAKPLQELTTIS